jgi:glycosyltransferase involved in cell wall biosynthesis
MSVDFSVVIPSFRRPKPLGEAIASVLGQPGVSVEVIVIDDSPEASAEGVVAAIGDARVRYLNNPAPSGGWPSSVRNLGWPLAQGDFIHFLDDDDIVPDGHYAAVKKIFAARPDVGVVFGRIEPFGDAPEAQLQQERAFFDDRARRARLCRLFGPRWGFTACMMFRRTLLICSAGVVRRECVERVGGHDARIRPWRGHRLLCLRHAAVGSLVHGPGGAAIQGEQPIPNAFAGARPDGTGTTGVGPEDHSRPLPVGTQRPRIPCGEGFCPHRTEVPRDRDTQAVPRGPVD